MKTLQRVGPGGWRETPAGAELLATWCASCRRWQFPPVGQCSRCLQPGRVAPLSLHGSVYASTTVRVKRGGYPNAYSLALVDLPENVRVFGRLRSDGGPAAPGTVVAIGAGPVREEGGVEFWSYDFVPSANGGQEPRQLASPIDQRRAATRTVPIGPAGAAVVGVGMVPFGKHAERSIAELGQQAVIAALRDGDIPHSEIEAAFCGNVYGGMLTGQRILKDLGLSGIPITNVENACSSGSTAIREAILAVSRGEIEVALAIGVEQLSRSGGGTLPLDSDDWNVMQGGVLPATYAMRAQRYLHQYGYDSTVLAEVSRKNREHASLDPYAHYTARVGLDDVLAARPIADPLTLLECSPNSDGAAAVIICSASRSKRYSSSPVRFLASALFSGELETEPIDITRDEITERTALEAYRQAGLGPADVSVCELHDAFSIAELIYYESLGFCEPGEGGNLLMSGATRLGGRIPVNTSGGLLSRGHPIGATGVAQIVEAVWQLRGDAELRQVEAARVALCHCTGGGIAGMDHGACAVHILSV